MRRAVDIFRHISDFRTKRAADRAQYQICGSHIDLDSRTVREGDFESAIELASTASRTQTFPALVLELVIDSILQDSYPLLSLGHLSDVQHLLGTMSLVHRSWTYLSQRALAENIKTDITEGMRQYICNPSFPTHTKRLRLRLLNDMKWGSPTATYPVSNEGSYLSSFVFSRFSNLRYFRLELHDITNGRALLGSLESNAPCIESLEELWLHITSRAFVEIICPIISDFRMLKTFGLIVSYDVGAESPIPALRPLNSVSPGANLECVYLDFSVDRIGPFVPTVKWLLEPRDVGGGTTQIKSVCYSDGHFVIHKDGAIFDTILEMSPCLTSLEFHCAMSKYTNKLNIFHSIVRRFKNLRRLGICDYLYTDTVPPEYVLQLIGSISEVYFKSDFRHYPIPFCIFEQCHRI